MSKIIETLDWLNTSTVCELEQEDMEVIRKLIPEARKEYGDLMDQIACLEATLDNIERNCF